MTLLFISIGCFIVSSIFVPRIIVNLVKDYKKSYPKVSSQTGKAASHYEGYIISRDGIIDMIPKINTRV